jgi:alpha-tubulin suppressor-like RCC1 family protein
MNLPFKALAALLALVTTARAAVVTASYSSVGTVPVTAAGYTATGNTVDFALNFAPPAGTSLTVVKVTGLGFIDGRFGNLEQGQRVDLTFGGVSYPFVANYYGGTGNDLVLQWANTRVVAWGTNGNGQLGSTARINYKVPEAVDGTGVLAGKTLLAVASGANHSLALCADGTLAAWGSNSSGEAGNNAANASEHVPVAVDRTGVLAGKTVIAIAAGGNHSLALCADGALVGWGSDYEGQLGYNGQGNTMTTAPVLIPATGVLAGKTVIAIAAGGSHTLALCLDGTLAAWGNNNNGQLGNNSTTHSNVPALVDQTGVLAGKTVIAISAGYQHNLALCSDGTVAAWGGALLGDGSTTSSNVPVLVDRTGVLAGKTVIAISAGGAHSLVLGADGTLAAWGENSQGQVGDGWSAMSVSRPVLVKPAPVLAGRLVTAIAAGSRHCLVRCADGIAGGWGSNWSGQVGNDSTNQASAPVFVTTTGLRAGERFLAVAGGNDHSIGITASPPPPVATTLAVSGITDSGATLNGTVNPNGQSTVVGFEYGLTTAYGSTASPTPATLTGTTAQPLAVTLTNLPNRTTYHYRVVATSPGGTLYGQDMTFATSDIASLAGLSLSAGTLTPGFESATTSYSAGVPFAVSSITVTPVAGDALATIRVQGVTVLSGAASAPVALAVGNTTISVVVAPPGAAFSKTYTVMVTRSPETYLFNSATTVPVTAAAFDATGRTIAFALGFAPPTGTTLTVVKNTGPNPIQGTFDNLSQGQRVELVFNGVVYPFLANYFGGTGNDLVLQWGNTRLLSWGENSSGQLGQNHTAQCLVPTPVVVAGALVGKQILSISVGQFHSLALCADGSIVAWGSNEGGRLGNGTTLSSPVPVAVDQTGVLAGKRVIAVSAGANFNLALCADGTLAAWGSNDYSQLGDGTNTSRMVPVAVDLTAGGFAGKKVSAVVAGAMHAVALCSDGTLVAWGYGNYGQLGNGTTSYSSPPVVVTKGTVLTGKTLVGLVAGFDHNMVLCSDGTLAAWGSNGWGAVGNNSATTATTPVAVVKTGVLSGKTLTAIAAGSSNSLARCSDNTLATWGDNTNGRLGNGSTTYSKVPVAVTRTGVLSGKTLVGVSPWAALCSDGALATWGDNTYGQLGNNTTTHSTTPVLANTTALKTGEKLLEVRSSGNFHLAVVAAPPAPSGTTLAATGIGDRTCTVRGTAIANGQSTTVSFQYGLTAGYGWSVAGTPSPVTGTAPVAVSAGLTGLLPGKTYHYRVVVTSGGGIVYGGDQEFTTTAQATLAGLVPSVGTLVPVLDPAVSSYSMSALPTTADITLAPTVAQQGATVTVAGTPVTSGTASGPVALAVGNTAIPVVVTAADGVTTMTYTVTVTRPPEVLAFNAAADVPVTAVAFDASGMTATFALGFAPPPGTVLTVVNQTGLEFIRGAFGNLAQGQEVELAYAGVRYRFIANYFGGTGNDLVLQWANVRLMAWGSNSSGQIGNGGQVWNGSGYTNSNLLVPTAVDAAGVLAGKTVMMAAAGGTSCLALCTDRTLAAWGEGGGRLGNGTTAGAVVPVLVDRSGVLAGKTVVALAVGSKHCLALCADGTVAAWGDNASGQLGNNSTTASTVPVLVDTSGVLAGRKVVMIATTGEHNLALCGDGTLVAWGENGWTGQLGNNSTTDSSVPVLVETGGLLYGRRVVEIAAGGGHSAALCADGTLAVWGRNNYGQLGLGNKVDTKVPVALPMTGVLAGKTIRSVSASYYHTMVWCADGTLAAWGYNASGGLGNNSTTDSMVPVAVVRSGVLSGKTVTRIATGWLGSAALCSDGKIATWGGNDYGQLGNNSNTSSSVPVLVNTTGLRAGERFVQGQMNGINSHTLALVGSVPEPSAVLTLAATATHDKGATLNGSVNANGSTTTVTFEYGLTTAYGTVVSATPATVTGTPATPVSAVVAGLPTGTSFHYRVIAASVGGVVKGEDRQVTTTDQATLAGLAVSVGTLDPGFAPVTTTYAVTVPTANLTVTPVASHADAAITVNGQSVASGAASEAVALVEGDNVITVGVTSGAGTDTGSYTLRVLRVPQVFRFTSASTVGIAVSSLRPAGAELRFELGFAPVPGCVLTVVNNTGGSPINGRFGNLAHGQTITLPFGGASYPFTANYFGGNGNDLVLEWANQAVFTWGTNTYGQLGNGGTTNGLVPAPISPGVLAGKVVVALAKGKSHSLALGGDGTLAAWGYNSYGQLGNGGSTNRSVPTAVTTSSGVLAGKSVTAIAAGQYHSLALCADGTLATWGYNNYGQLGNGTTTNSSMPVAVTTTTGVLAGKTVVAIAAGNQHSLALCADGTLAAWGYNGVGSLGNGSSTNSSVPVAVTATGALAGKTPVAIAVGDNHNLALCSNGTMVAWGYNLSGQLGDGSTNNSYAPVNVTATGVLAGKTVTGIAAGVSHSLALCADGIPVAWGYGYWGQLGNGTSGGASSSVPVLVANLGGKTITAIDAGASQGFALDASGMLVSWGSNDGGVLGFGGTANSNVPVAVATSALPSGAVFTRLAGGSQASHAMAVVAIPLSNNSVLAGLSISPGVLEQAFAAGTTAYSVRVLHGTPSIRITPTVADVAATVTVNGAPVASGTASPPIPWSPGDPAVTVLVTAQNGSTTDYQVTFHEDATLAGLSLSPGSLTPALAPATTSYTSQVGTATTAVTVTPSATDPAATITVNGQIVTSGSASNPINLSLGTTPITVTVTATDGTAVSYTITVLRPGPLDFSFTAASDVATTWAGYTATGNSVNLALGFTPAGPVNLTVVNNTGLFAISGRFDNLAQGQMVSFTRDGQTFMFMADYCGGTGNDLILRWANNKAYAWGANTNGQLGTGNTTNTSLPVAVTNSGVLAGRTITALARGDSHSLALCADGTLAAWGSNTYGQLGAGNKTASPVPVAVVTTGALAGKNVIAIAVGIYHCLALCADGTVVGWGRSDYGQIGVSDSTVPVVMPASGALAGKAVIAIAAGSLHSLALCADGSIAGWGWNTNGQLGNGRPDGMVRYPVAVATSGVLAGKTPIAIAAGYAHSLALAADGTVVAWGENYNGQLGNGSTTPSSVPVAVTATGVLAGKTVTAISAGYNHNLVRCADGSLAAWGYNYFGQLGNGTTTSSNVPVAVTTTGILAGKTITTIAAGYYFSNALCTDGTLAAWGHNGSGQLGNGTTSNSYVPVAVTTSGLGSGEKFNLLAAGSLASHTLALVTTPLSGNSTLAGLALDTGTLSPAFAPGVTTYTAQVVHGTAAIRVTPATAQSFAQVTVNGSPVASGTASPPIALTPGSQTLTIKVTAQDGTATTYAVTVRDDTSLTGLALSTGTLGPAFAPSVTAYTAYVSTDTTTLTVTPTAKDGTATVSVNGTVVAAGAASDPLALAPGANPITVRASGLDGGFTDYIVTMIRQVPLAAAFAAATTVPVTAAGYTATFNTVDLSLGFEPATGTALTVINNTGRDFITGRFANLAQGQVLGLVYNTITYQFVANYYGGTGNDLVLQWADAKPYAWGLNNYGQLGDGTTTVQRVPTAVTTSGALAGKTLLAVAGGNYHCLVLCADGSLAAWGLNDAGQLGNGTTTNSGVPVAVTATGALAGKTVIAIAVGANFNLVLCEDGSLVAWGNNGWGQLGDGTFTNSPVPVAVTTTGVLAGKTVMSIATGDAGSLALCTDGTLAAWGANNSGALGNGTTTNSSVPVIANTTSGILAGKTISAAAAGVSRSMVLCGDGTIASWGYNGSGQLGNGTTTDSTVPVAVSTAGILAGKPVVAVTSGNYHCLARCADGSLAAWGANDSGQLGIGNNTNSKVPAAIVTSGVLAGKTVTTLAAGYIHGLALCADGTLAAWGTSTNGELGAGSTAASNVPTAVSTASLGLGETFVAAATGAGSHHSIALAAVPVTSNTKLVGLTLTPAKLTAPFAPTTLAYTALVTRATTAVTVTPTAADPNSTVTVNGTVVASGAASQEIPRVPGSATTITIGVTAPNGTDITYTVTLKDDATLAGLDLSTGPLSPAFATDTTNYVTYVLAATLTVTPTATDPTAAITVNTVAVASGSASNPLSLVPGANSITVKVTALDGSTTSYVVSVVRQVPLSYTFAAATGVAATAASYTATGNTVNLALNFAPPAGTNLTVVNNTGTAPIQGAFTNLAQGQLVQLTYGGVTYAFVANYYGGTGNDLVLQWANTRLLAWGNNSYGQLGNNSTTQSTLAVPVDRSGVLAGKTVVRIAEGNAFSLALCADGTLAAWGINTYGQLGDNSTTTRTTPVAVVQTGVLADKTVVAIGTGETFCLVLCSDGTLAAWGRNSYGNLGTGGGQSTVPVLVNQTGVLAGKAVTAIAAGGNHCLVLCADGTLAAWGYNNYAQLGDGTTTDRTLPVLVTSSGVLAGKTVTTIAAGSFHNLALCSDGTLATWGYNSSGQLGNASTTDSSVPVLVVRTGVLSGKTVTALNAGGAQSLALCSNGTVASWGYNTDGQLGNGNTTNSNVPVTVTATGALAGKTVQAIECGYAHSLAVCSDGTLASWGSNSNGQLGNGTTTNSSVPVTVTRNGMATAERFVAAAGGPPQTLAMVAVPPAPLAVSAAATAIADTRATLNGTVNAQGNSTAVSFEYGLTTAYGTTVAATPATVTGTTTTAASAALTGLLAGSTYHFRVIATNDAGTVKGYDQSFTTTTAATLADLTLGDGTLTPGFASLTTAYFATVPFGTTSLTVTPSCTDPAATVAVDGGAVASGTASTPQPLLVGNNLLTILVTAAGGGNQQSYSVMVTRLPETLTFSAAATVPIASANFAATGTLPPLTLAFAPPVGTNLTLVNNTGTGSIQGTFANLAQGQAVTLTYAGVSYPFVANYFGGSGNDLVLQWANTRLMAWGGGALGNRLTTGSLVPTPVDMTGTLAGKVIVGMAVGDSHCVTGCSDGTIATWGTTYNSSNGTYTSLGLVPTPVDATGALAGRTVVRVAAAYDHSLALCADGALVAWGGANRGQLGNNASGGNSPPVLVDRTGVLAGKTIMDIAAGLYSSYALCADGTLAAWGSNSNGQLGNSAGDAKVPVAVSRSGALAGKTVIRLAVGWTHCIALCSDGTLAAWGSNTNGQLGNNSTRSDLGEAVPVAVVQTGVLAGKTVTAIGAGYDFSACLCSDGTLAAWGYNDSGQLGNNSTTNSSVPVLVDRSGVLAGRTVVSLAPLGFSHVLALCADGAAAAWGSNAGGQLGNNSITHSSVPVLVTTTSLNSSERIVAMDCGSDISLALVASPPAPLATTLAATNLHDTSATLNGSAMANGQTTAVIFEYGLTTAYGSVIAASPATILDTTVKSVSATPTGLLAATIYHFRVVATSAGGTTRGDDMTFTTTGLATLASLALDGGTLRPGFASPILNYNATVPFAATTVTLTPVTTAADAIVTVAGTPVAAGAASQPVAIEVGNNRIEVVVTASGGTSATYVVTATRLPEVFAFDSATTVPVTANGLLATGQVATFALNFAPPPGTTLTVVNNTGADPMGGNFSNLAPEQTVNLTYAGVVYPFVADYGGGTGNDLVLRWANMKLMSWGDNYYRQLGNGGSAYSGTPGPVITSGVLAGKTVTGIFAGPASDRSFALCQDGSLAAWGNYPGASSGMPVAVDLALADKRLVTVAVGNGHSLALCADGTLVSWGDNVYGQLGRGGETGILVDRSGVLAGKTVVAIAAGGAHSLALCSDGTLAAWGRNAHGQLGIGTTGDSGVPVLVSRAGVLAGKTPVAIACGVSHNLILCADGEMAAWGYNSDGQLGGAAGNISSVPVLVTRSGLLSGKTVTAVSSGRNHCLALCSDNTVAAWGDNSNGQLGNGNTTSSGVPVAVTQTGAVAGKTVAAITAGGYHSFARCTDGTLYAWGWNSSGQLGNSYASDGKVPTPAGARFVAVVGGMKHSVGLLALPPPPAASPLAASGIADTGATLNGEVSPNGSATAVSFEYGPTAAYGTVVSATPGNVTGTGAIAVNAPVSGLLAGTVYHYRMIVTNEFGSARSEEMTFTTTNFGSLADLGLSSGALVPGFNGATTRYLATVPFEVASIAVTPVTAHAAATVSVNETAVPSGSPSAPISLAVGQNVITATVIAADGVTTASYVITVTRLPAAFTFNSATDVPVVAGAFAATGKAPDFVLNYQPAPVTVLTVVKNTGNGAVRGRFTNLAQGQLVPLTYEGVTRYFIANYYGGSGNDLVLQPANTRLLAWGNNGTGQLGNGSTTASSVPVPVDRSGVLAGKAIVAIVNGGDGFVGHGNSVALCADGTLAAWGSGERGQLGNGGTTDSQVPVAVDQTGVLAGKTVVSISAGASHLIVQCADGTVATWGYNMWGALGNNSLNNSPEPVLVNTAGVLAGKTVIAVAAGAYHSLALCADGTLAAWGNGGNGQLGNNGTTDSKVPVAVNQTGVLAGKTVVAIAAGGHHNLALCADGTLAAWGYNADSQLGNNLTTTSLVPTLVDRSGVLANRTITSIAAGEGHSLALCSDGIVVAWGDNGSGQVGTLTPGYVPDLVDRSGALSGKTVVGIAAGRWHSLAVCSDGTMVAWGYNGYGQLGNNSTINSVVPVAVDQSALGDGESFIMGGRGQSGDFSLGLTSVPMPTAATLPASGISGTGAILNGSVNANGNATTVAFEFGLGETYGTSLAAVPAALSGGGATLVSATIGGLLPGTTYHYRVVAAYQGLWFRGADMTFTTLSDNAWLTDLGHDGGAIAPGFEKPRFEYWSSVPFATTAVTVSAVTDHPRATIMVNGAAANLPVNLAVGNNTLTTVVTAEDGITTKTYTIAVTRLPLEFVFNSASDVPVTANGFTTGGNPVNIVLRYPPTPGTVLTMVNNTGLGFIYGRFGNLAQGQRVSLRFDGRNYDFIANYHGGTGNDLVLQWATTELLAWGGNGFGQLGDDTTTRRLVPTPVNEAGVLANKSVLAVAGGYLHSLALCADGTLAAWGYNVYGQLGNNGSATSLIPAAVDQAGALAGKTVVAIAAGPFHNLALCEDGTVVSWGYNNHGQLGDGTKVTRRAPVVVARVGALASMQVVAVAAGAYQSFALGADGTVAAWGYNDEGELGDGTTNGSLVPVAVDHSGALAGKQVASLAVGQYHTVALCTDATLVAWGYNNRGQLGNASTTDVASPVAIGAQGALAGRTPVGISAGSYHSLARCADGTVVAWGANNRGQLGVAVPAQSALPLAVDVTGVASGGGIAGLATGGNHSLLRLADGRLAAWGENTNGQLGDDSLLSSALPTEVTALTGRIMAVASGAAALHNLALQAMPMVQGVTRTVTAADLTGADLIGYAFQLDPSRPGGAQLPEGRMVEDEYVIRFTQPARVADVVYGAEWSATMQPGSWQEVPDTGSSGEHRFAIPVTGASQGFIRLKVSAATR